MPAWEVARLLGTGRSEVVLVTVAGVCTGAVTAADVEQLVLTRTPGPRHGGLSLLPS